MIDYDDFLSAAMTHEARTIGGTDDRLARGRRDGLAACRHLAPGGLDRLRRSTEAVVHACEARVDPDLPYWRARYGQIVRVVDLVSAYLELVGHPTIIHPTSHGADVAAELVKKAGGATGTAR